MAQVGVVVGAVGADVAGVDDEVGLRRLDVGEDGVPLLVGAWGAGGEVAVADLQHATGGASPIADRSITPTAP